MKQHIPSSPSIINQQVFLSLLSLCLLIILSACNLGASAPTPVPTPDLPTIEILSPENGSTVFEAVEFTIDIVARDETSGVARIELYVDGEKINEAVPESGQPETVFRVNMNWLARGVGLHVITARSFRGDGTPSDEAILSMEVLSR